MIVAFTILGKPKSWQRISRGRFGGVFNPSAMDEKVVAEYAFAAMSVARIAKFISDVCMTVSFYGCRSNADLSNYIKLIEDACNKIVYHDDKQIVAIHAYKSVKSDGNPRTEIRFEEC